MDEIITKEEKNIESMIYEIRVKQVMLDSDLATLYGCANGTKSINLAVKRHLNKFPERFMFQLTRKEYYDVLRFQNETLALKQGAYNKYLSNIDADVILICKNNLKLNSLDIEKYNEEYNNLRVIYDDTFHDRFLIIDKKEVYHLGASLNYVGRRTFGINKLEDKEVINLLIKRVENLCKVPF